MLRLVLASLAGAATAFVVVQLVPETNLALLGVGLVAMFVVAGLLPHVFFRGEPLRKPSQPLRT